MAVKSSNLFAFVLLVLVGAGVVFLGPSLVGYVPLGSSGNFVAANYTYLYPVSVDNSGAAGGPQNAVSNDNPDIALLGMTTTGSHLFTCPNSYGTASFTGPWWNSTTGLTFCQFDLAHKVTGWLQTSFRYVNDTGAVFSSPSDITAVQVNASANIDACPGLTSGDCSLPIKYQIFASTKCTGSSSTMSWKSLGECTLASSGSSVTCTKTLERTRCPGGKWDVGNIVVGRSFYGRDAPDVRIEWIRARRAG